MADQVTDKVSGAKDKASETAGSATGTLREQTVGAFTNAARDILGPAIQQMSEQAAKQAAEYAKQQGPKLVKEQVLPQVMKSVGADNPGDVAKMGIGKVGEAMSGAGGITGIAGKMFSKIGRKGGGQATGYGKGRRMPIQQDIMVSLPRHEVYKAWTEYKRWPEFMHRVNGADPDISEDSASLRVTEKMWGFTRPFTAEVTMQRPDEVIRWKSTNGPNHVGLIAFHELGDYLTLISINIDHSPKGPVEKLARGNRFVKRAIRADLHRFKGWLEHRSGDELEDIEGWMGTIEDGEIVKTHDEYEEAEQGPEPLQQDKEDDEDGEQAEAGEEQDSEDVGEGEQEDEESGEEDGEEDLEEDQEVDTADEEDYDEDEDEEEPEEEEEELEEEEEEEPEPAPKPKKSRAKSKSAKKTRPKRSRRVGKG